MAITRQKKTEILDKVSGILKKSKSVVFVNFRGLKVADVNEIRAGLRAQGVGYYVPKKTLLKKALADQKVEGTMPSFDGELGIVYSEDLILPAKEISAFAKKKKENLKLLGGIMESKFISLDEVKTLAAIPSREVLLAQLLNVMNGPVRGFATVLNGVPRGFVVALDQIAQKK